MMTALRRVLLVLLAAFPLLVQAAPSAHEVIQRTTDELLADLKANKEQYRQDPSAFYDSLNDILGPVVDAEGISRSIMTVKYSRNATPAQMTRFQENFKRSLISRNTRSPIWIWRGLSNGSVPSLSPTPISDSIRRRVSPTLTAVSSWMA